MLEFNISRPTPILLSKFKYGAGIDAEVLKSNEVVEQKGMSTKWCLK